MSPGRVARVTAFKILVGALLIVPLRFPVFARALAIPFTLYVILDSVWLFQPALDFYQRFRWLMFPLWQLTELALYTVSAVVIHRIVLLGAASVPRYGVGWTRHTTIFFTFLLVLTSLSYAVAVAVSRSFEGAGGFLLLIAFILVWLGWAFGIARLLLVFPAAAVGEPITLTDSWNLTHDRKALMCLVAIVYPIFVDLPTRLIPESSTIGYLMRSLSSLLALTITVILLSFAYQQILKERASSRR